MERGTVPSRGNSSDDPTSRSTDLPTASGRRTYDASRRQAEAVERRRRVIDAAHDLFLTDGYGATSINEIARAADVSPQMIYASFGSKAGILAKLTDVVVAGDDAALHGDDGPLLPRAADGQGSLRRRPAGALRGGRPPRRRVARSGRGPYCS